MKPTQGVQRFCLCAALGVLLFGSNGCKSDETTSPGGGTTIVPITSDLFPVVAGHKYTFVGWARTPRPLSGGGGAVVSDPTSSYRTIWTVGPTGGTATALIDST